MTHRFAFLSLMFFGVAIGAATAAPSPAPSFPAYPGGAGCEKPAGAVAWIAPCSGHPGSDIWIYPQRAFPSPPDTIVFRQPTPGPGPVQVTAPLTLVCLSLKSVPPIGVVCPSGRQLWKAPAPLELCRYGGKWSVSLQAAGKNLGGVGRYKIACKAEPGLPPPPVPRLLPPPPPKPPKRPPGTPTPTPTQGLHVRRTPAPYITTLFAPRSPTPAPTKSPTHGSSTQSFFDVFTNVSPPPAGSSCIIRLPIRSYGMCRGAPGSVIALAGGTDLANATALLFTPATTGGVQTTGNKAGPVFTSMLSAMVNGQRTATVPKLCLTREEWESLYRRLPPMPVPPWPPKWEVHRFDHEIDRGTIVLYEALCTNEGLPGYGPGTGSAKPSLSPTPSPTTSTISTPR
jgi:hypothetical protein